MRKKTHSTNLFIFVLFIVAVLLGYNYYARPFLRNYHQQSNESSSPEAIDQEKEKYVEQKLSVLDSFSNQQKVSQLMALPYTIDLEATELDEDGVTATASAQIQELEPGSITIFGSLISQEVASKHIEDIYALFSDKEIYPLIAVDHEGGDVQRFSGDGFTALPSWRELCVSDQQGRKELLRSSAQELSALGVTTVFAPVLDIDSSALGSRSCADFDELELAAWDYIDVFGSNQIMSVIKHFPGLGGTTRDLHFYEETISLRDGDTRIFSEVLTKYPNIGVMSSHVKLQDLLEGAPCSLSEECLFALSENFPLSLIFTDALEMEALTSYGQQLIEEFEFLTLSQEEVKSDPLTARLAVLSYEALLAGNDILVFGKDVEYDQLIIIREELAARMDQDERLAQRVEASATKVMAVKRVTADPSNADR